MDRYDSERLIQKFGFEKGLDLLNVLTANQLGMISGRRVAEFLRENLQFFNREEEFSAQTAG
ncbi:MAG: hypothetical protein O2954_12340 [bacterium]|nr:hypothetical protein [bacterium]